jgi:hypothetical protein
VQQWLGERIQVEAVEVAAEDSRLTVKVAYLLRNGERRTAELSREI